MKIKNKEWSPLNISLPDGRSITLAARGINEISDEDFQSPEFQRLAKARTIIVLPEESPKEKEKPGAALPEEKKKPSGAEMKPSKPRFSPPGDSEENQPQ